MAPKQKFADGEKVLCFHGPLIYEAKCLKSIVTPEKIVKYFVHYAGWNKNWDEWVPETRVLKYNEGNIARQKEVQKAHSSQTMSNKGKKSKNRKSDNLKESGSPAAVSINEAHRTGKHKLVSGHDSGSESNKKKRARLDPNVETEEQHLNKLEIKLKLPDELKPWLVDDWDFITRQRKLPNIPARITVDEIINNYVTYKKSAKNNNMYRESVAIEVSNGIKEYFNVMLATQLLYKFERPHHTEVVQEKTDVPMSKIYGAIHLLRLFVKLGPMLAYTPLDERSIQLLRTHIQDFMKYIIKNTSSILSLQDYTSASNEYIQKAV